MTSAVRIGTAAQLSGLSVHTIRFYESRGLLPAAGRTESGYRSYDQQAIRQLRLIRNARDLGLGLADIEALVPTNSDEQCGEYVTRLLALVEVQRHQVQVRLADLQRLSAELDAVAVELEAIRATAVTGHLTVAECTCCPMLDGHPVAGQCTERGPNELQNATKGRDAVTNEVGFSTDRISDEHLLEVLGCELDKRPSGAPGPRELLPSLITMELSERALTMTFAKAATPIVHAFAEAERSCCSGIGWSVAENDDCATLQVTGTPEQLEVIGGGFRLVEAGVQ